MHQCWGCAQLLLTPLTTLDSQFSELLEELGVWLTPKLSWVDSRRLNESGPCILFSDFIYSNF